MSQFHAPFGIRFPVDLEHAVRDIADEQGKSFAGVAKGAILLVHRDRLIEKLNMKRYEQLLSEYVTEQDQPHE